MVLSHGLSHELSQFHGLAWLSAPLLDELVGAEPSQAKPSRDNTKLGTYLVLLEEER